MLSDHEQRELTLIEHGLAADDRRFVRALQRRRLAGPRRWPSRVIVGFGVLVLVVGLVAGADTVLVLQGLLITGTGVVWSRWRVRRTGAEPGGGDSTRPNPHSAGPPSKWFRRS